MPPDGVGSDELAGRSEQHAGAFVEVVGRRVREAEGAEIMIEGTFGTSQAIYVDAGGGPGTLVEILQQAKDGPDLFGMIKAAGVGWDGSEPLRKLG